MLPPLAAFQLAFADIFAAHFDISSCHYAISFISSLLMPFSLPAVCQRQRSISPPLMPPPPFFHAITLSPLFHFFISFHFIF
jgi:hypothetical protein